MTPEQFVKELKDDVRRGVDGTLNYLADPPGKNPLPHLAILSKWYRGLSDEDKRLARMAMEYAADGSLFGLLNVLDDYYDLPSSVGGFFELYFVKGEKRIKLNEPGHYLHDIFDNTWAQS